MASAFSYEQAPYVTSAFATDNGTVAIADERRRLAAIDANYHHTFPTHVVLNDVSVPICKFAELEKLNLPRLRQKALNLRDVIESTGSRFFEHHTHLKYRATGAESIVAWIVAVQVAVCSALGYDFDNTSFGAPPDENYRPPTAPSAATQNAPCWSQHDLDDRMHQNRKLANYKQAQSPLLPKSAAPYAESDLHQYRPPTGYVRSPAPYAEACYDEAPRYEQRASASLPPRADYERPSTADRFDDAARIRASMTGSFQLG